MWTKDANARIMGHKNGVGYVVDAKYSFILQKIKLMSMVTIVVFKALMTKESYSLFDTCLDVAHSHIKDILNAKSKENLNLEHLVSKSEFEIIDEHSSSSLAFQ